MWRPGIAEIIIVLIVVLVLFGPGRITKIARELGASITAFKEGLAGGSKGPESEQSGGSKGPESEQSAEKSENKED